MFLEKDVKGNLEKCKSKIGEDKDRITKCMIC